MPRMTTLAEEFFNYRGAFTLAVVCLLILITYKRSRSDRFKLTAMRIAITIIALGTVASFATLFGISPRLALMFLAPLGVFLFPDLVIPWLALIGLITSFVDERRGTTWFRLEGFIVICAILSVLATLYWLVLKDSNCC